MADYLSMETASPRGRALAERLFAGEAIPLGTARPAPHPAALDDVMLQMDAQHAAQFEPIIEPSQSQWAERDKALLDVNARYAAQMLDAAKQAPQFTRPMADGPDRFPHLPQLSANAFQMDPNADKRRALQEELAGLVTKLNANYVRHQQQQQSAEQHRMAQDARAAELIAAMRPQHSQPDFIGAGFADAQAFMDTHPSYEPAPRVDQMSPTYADWLDRVMHPGNPVR